MASLKVEICLKKKNPLRAEIFRCFRYESRNKKTYIMENFIYSDCDTKMGLKSEVHTRVYQRKNGCLCDNKTQK